MAITVSAFESPAIHSLEDVKSPYARRPLSVPQNSYPRHQPGGVLDFDAYLKYMVDDPKDVPAYISGYNPTWMHHHPYYQRDFYEQKDIREDRRLKFLWDQQLTQFANYSYNQLVLRRHLEALAHKENEEMVSPPDPEFQRLQIMDFKNLDALGAAAVGMRVALVPEAYIYLMNGDGVPGSILGHSPLSRAVFFESEMDRSIKSLQSPYITSDRIVTGAIYRMGKLLNSNRMLEEAERRIAKDEIFMPVRVPSFGRLYGLSVEMLKQNTEAEFNLDETPNKVLQTGVDTVELQAA